LRAIVGGRTWLLGLLVVPIFLGFFLVGGQLGIALGTATAAALVIIAARARPDEPIEVAAPAEGVPGGVLILALAPIEDPRTAGLVGAIADPARPESGAPLLIAPARTKLLDRWADDLDAARFESQRLLTVSLASLAAAGIEAEGRVGDGDPLRAAEDALRTYAATEVVIVAREGEERRRIEELERRLELPLRRVGP
jgi:hypothetical protein